MPIGRHFSLLAVIAAAALAVAADRPAPAPAPAATRFEWPPEQKRILDSMLALPDSLWDFSAMFGLPPGTPPPGFDRAQVIAFYRRMVRAPESLYVGPDSAHRTDAEMTATFATHRRDFERLLAMLQADSAVNRVDLPGYSFYTPPSPLPAPRREEYERLMRVVGVRFLIRQSGNMILFRCTTIHTFDRKGYAWSNQPLKPVVDQETTDPRLAHWVVYRHLRGGWYIYFQANS